MKRLKVFPSSLINSRKKFELSHLQARFDMNERFEVKRRVKSIDT